MWNCTFGSFKLFPSTKIAIFEIAKNGIWSKKNSEIDLFDFTIFFVLDFFKFSGLPWINTISRTIDHDISRSFTRVETDRTGALLINNRKLARAEKNVLPFLEPREWANRQHSYFTICVLIRKFTTLHSFSTV